MLRQRPHAASTDASSSSSSYRLSEMLMQKSLEEFTTTEFGDQQQPSKQRQQEQLASRATTTTTTKRVPRKLEMERQRRHFEDQDIETLLLARGADYYSDDDSLLPLEYFDVERDFGCPGPCKALYDGRWQDAQLLEGGRVRVGEVEVELHRLRVYSLSENPFKFADRVALAHSRRRASERALLTNFFVDNMPVDDLRPLDPDLRARIVALATSGSKKFDDDATRGDQTRCLVNEANLDYLRTLNKIIYEREMRARRDAADDDDERDENVPPQNSFKTVESEQPEWQFSQMMESFTFHSFLTRPEVIRIFVAARLSTTTHKLLVPSSTDGKQANNLFSLSTKKSVRLDEFENGQLDARSATRAKLQAWVASVGEDVRTHLKDVKKGWFNLEETSNEVYNFSKMKKFLRALNLFLQDQLREMLVDSLERFASFLEERRGTFVVEVEFDESSQDFVYTTNPNRFVEACLASFDGAVEATKGIVSVERRVMTKLFWSHDSVMTFDAPEIAGIRRRVEKTMREGVQPLSDHLSVYALPVDDAIEGDVGALIALARKETPELPEDVTFGPFHVSLSHVRKLVVERRARTTKAAVDLACRRTIDEASNISAAFSDLVAKLSSKPRDIEELTELRNLKDATDEMVRKIRLEDVVADFDRLECARIKCGATKYDVLFGPKLVADKTKAVDELLAKKAKEFEQELCDEKELFGERLRSLAEEIDHLETYDDLGLVDQVSTHVRRIKADLDQAGEKEQLFQTRDALFGHTVQFQGREDLSAARKRFEPYFAFWDNADRWMKNHDRWTTSKFLELDAELVEQETTAIERALKKCQKKKMATPSDKVLEQIEVFKPNVPLLVALRRPGMRERHWEQLGASPPDDSYTLDTVTALGLDEQTVNKVSDVASKEFAIETSLKNMEEAWAVVPLQIEKYKETGTSVLKGIDDYATLLDEQITTTQAMTFSNFKGPFGDSIERWNSTLQVVSEVLEEWVAVQKNWLYLEPIFCSPDINKQLPVEGKRFATVDKHWRQTMASATGGLAVAFCNDPKLLGRFQESNKLLDLVQRGLSDYLEQKRSGFSRFFFLSDGDLLEILSETTKDPSNVQPHMRKCFEGIKKLTFDHELAMVITEMVSPELEVVPLLENVDPKGKNIEDWMVEMNVAMCRSVRDQMIRAVVDYSQRPRTEWMVSWPGQVVLNGSQIHWTGEVERALVAKGNVGLVEYHQKAVDQLSDMVYLIRSGLTKNERTTVGALAVIDVHARDVIKNMADDPDVTSPSDFDWQSQMRFYWQEGDVTKAQGDLFVVQVGSKRSYGYEYLGNSFRLVITPLTDKCYLTLMGALQMVLGGAPAGPAGTGKTETTKDLAKALAKQCVVFNCSDGLDFRAMGKFFKGLASSGAWACFDEFNRINVEVLSVIAQQIMTLQGAVQRREERIVFEDTDINVDPEFAVFITMNPGYAGRSELPDNLEALFRPVAMMVPDYALIGEIMLFSYGYMNNRACAAKMVATFRLCSEQLSSQDHYDYGMRAVKTVITAAGNLKRTAPEENEESLLLRALQDVNVPKFLAQDLPLFAGILSDLFPGVQRPPFDYGPLLSALKLAADDIGLQAVPVFLRKNIELYEMICVRHGLMVVGPTGAGKSSNIETLRRALTSLQGVEGTRYEKVEVHHLNPKSITMGQLYGMFDVNTHEWQDGVLASLVRACIKNQSETLQWILFDGPVDAIWIENMNTVLDDNKKLCLTSGEIMSLTEQMTMMFEPEDLAVASPATVSRCGMIFMEPTSLGVDPIVQSWMDRKSAGESSSSSPSSMAARSNVRALIARWFRQGVAFLRRFLFEPFPTVDAALLESLLNVIDCFEGKEVTEPYFVFAFVWSVACTVDSKGRKAFDVWIRANYCFGDFPTEGTVYDYVYDGTRWVSWMDTISPCEFDSSASFAELIVPTIDSVRYTYLLDTLSAKQGKHVLMTGPTGTGKTVNVSRFLQSASPEKNVLPVCLTFSAQTSANQVQDSIDSKCEKRRKGIFGPPVGKKLFLFVDDMNMPTREEYGAQPPIELLRQWFDSSGWYDRKTLQFRRIVDVVFVCACGPPGGGRNPVSARFPRHFNTVGYTPTQDESMKLIFSTILGGGNDASSATAGDAIRAMTGGIVDATIAIYNTILKELRPTPQKSHYLYNLRDVSKVFQGMLMAKRIESPQDMVDLFVHENERVFADRLINEADHDWFDALVCREGRKHLGGEFFEQQGEQMKHMFGDFMATAADGAQKLYQKIRDDPLPVIEEYLSEHNLESRQPMDLVMFADAIQHVSRISRVIRQPKGNALLLGVGGSGRQSLAKLATFMAEYKLFQIEISQSYGIAEWRENLKDVLMTAGLENEPVVFVFKDSQIVFPGMLEDLNNVLNTGDVPNLYAVEDDEAIMSSDCKQDCLRKRLQPTKLNIFAQFIARVQANIHLVLCMSPLGEAFRNRLRKFPSIVNCCTIDWFAEWPDEALRSVAMSSLSAEDNNLGHHLESAVSFVKHAHVSVALESSRFLRELGRHNFVTPTSYLELLGTYKNVLALKRDEVGTLKTRLQVGLDKLISTATQVAELQVQLTDMEPKLIKTQGEVEEMIVKIDADKIDAAETQKIVSAEEASAREKEAETKSIADDAQRDLDQALPALDEAVRCLNSLKKADIDEVRTMGKPPSGVKLTMEACCIMFSVKPDLEKGVDGKKVPNYFKAAQREILSLGQKLIDKMKGYDKDNIPSKIIKEIGPYVTMDEFKPSVIEKASKACTAMCMWVRAMHKYHDVSVMVEPKKKLLAEAQSSLAATQKTLAEAQAKLKEVMDKIEKLEADFSRANAKKEQLAKDVGECAARLVRAKKLIGGLGGEQTRWTESCARLEVDYENLVGDSMVSAATIAYSGPFTPEFRKAFTKNWQQKLESLGVPHSKESCDILGLLSDPVKIRAWTLQHGLPQDSHSIENGVIMETGRRFPLLIDPQGQANRYIKNMGGSNLDVTKLSANFLKATENALRFGRWILLEDVGESLDASLEPLLLQQKFTHGGQVCIRLGDSTIPWNQSFRFFITTTIASPVYAPEVCVKVSLINFAITPSGLEDQLLGVVVSEERPDLAEKKNSLVVNNAAMKKTLADIEDKILSTLSNSTGNILDDDELISTLATSKETSEKVSSRVAEAELTEIEIDASRERYRLVATKATELYFKVTSLRAASPMYQYSLQWFTDLFVQAIRDAEPSKDLDQRLANLSDFFLFFLYDIVSRSLFEKHKLLFSLLLAPKGPEWSFFVTGKSSSRPKEDASLPKRPEAEWVDARMWAELCEIPFEGLAEHFASHLGEWKERVFDSPEPQNEEFPFRLENKFQKLCVLRCIRADKVPDGVIDYVIETLGRKFVEPPPFDLELSARAASAKTPFIFVLTKGSDPTKAFDDYCSQRKKNPYKLSLGQGQGPKAAQLLADGRSTGAWVYLQNCHLFVSWLIDLEKFFAETAAADPSSSPPPPHKEFRLWLTSMPCAEFPVSVLQNSVKVTNEPPKGLRANLKSVFFKLDDTKLSLTSKPDVYRKLLFALVFFHAVVQERRKFGPLGWNVPYEFNDTDLDISKDQLEMFLDQDGDEGAPPPFRVLRFLTSYINYGGRVTDSIDLRTIDVIMKSFYDPRILEKDAKFEGGGYRSIDPDPESPHASYVAYVDSLPLVAPPSVFGMHDNAAISYMLNETFDMFDTFVSLEKGGGRNDSAVDDEAVLLEVRTIHERLAKRGRFDIEQISLRYPVVYEESMNTVLAQECIRYNKLVDKMLATLPELDKALRGLVVMSSELEAMTAAIAVAAVPEPWRAYPSLKKLHPWTEDFMRRLDFIRKWIDDGIPTIFWISGFYFPQAFLTGSMQNFARAHKHPIDTIDFDFNPTSKTPTEQPKDGVYVDGLFLEGARWDPSDGGGLTDSRPKQLYSPAPVVHFKPVKDRKPPTCGIYRCPVYKILSRRGVLSTTGHSTNFIMWIELPSTRRDSKNNLGLQDQLDWIKAGVAAFCSLKF